MGRSLGCPGAPDAPRGARARRPADRRPHRAPPRPHLHRGLRRRGDDLLRLHAAGGHRRSSSCNGGTDVTLDGRPAPYADGRIALTDLAATNTVRVTARMPYVTDGDGMTVTIDPADGERYVCAHTSMDIAQKVVPCFDQPDIKSTFTLSSPRPSHWTVLGQRRARGAGRRGATRLDLRDDAAFSSYLFTLVGGPWVSVTWDEPYAPAPGGTLPFGWHARASQGRELQRDADELRRITSACFQHYTTIFEPRVRLRRLPAGLRARSQLGRDGVPRVRGLPRRGAHPGHAHRARARVDRLDHRPRDGAHVVRRPGDDEVVGGLLAQRVLRRLHGLRRRRRGRRLHRRLDLGRDHPQAQRATAPTGAARRTRSPRTPRRSSTSTRPSPTST